MRALRLDVALPVAAAFLVGMAGGLTVGWLVGKGGQLAPLPEAAAMAGDAAAPEAAASEEADLRQMLAVHEQLLAEKPDDPALLRTVGNYHSALGQREQALELLQRSEARAREQGLGPGEIAAILTDQGILRAERGENEDALSKLEEAARVDPADTRSRLVQAYVYLTRVMPNPPPGFDRRQAVARVEALISEVLALEPANADALQFQALLASVRAARPRAGAELPPPPAQP